MIKKPEKEKEANSISELDEKLIADKDGSLKKSIMQKLEAYQVKVKAAMNKGDLAPNQFDAAEQMSKAIGAAKEVIQDRINKDK